MRTSKFFSNTNKRTGAIRRMVAIISIVALVLTLPFAMGQLPEGLQPVGNNAYAEANLKITSTGDTSAVQGDTVNITFRVENLGNIEAEYDSAELCFDSLEGLTTSEGNTGSVTLGVSGSASASAVISFTGRFEKNCDTGTRSYWVKIKKTGTDIYTSRSFNFNVSESISTPESGTGNYLAAVDINHVIKPAEGFQVGADNSISFEIYNKGNTVIKDATATLVLPDDISVYNSSNSVNLGYVSTGQRKNVEFPISVADTAQAKNYVLKLEISGVSYNNQAVKLTKDFYIPVLGQGTSSIKSVAIEAVNYPGTVTIGKDFIFSFNVKNNGSVAVKNLKVDVELPEGILNKNANTFIENTIKAGQSKNYSINMFANGAGSKSYPVKISVTPLGATDNAATTGTFQYASIFVEGDSSNAKTPQLIIDNYSYGGSSVMAGNTFVLNVGLYNTSSKTITNIKTSLTSEDGTFVPVGSSNSFFVEKIAPKGHYTKKIMLATKPDAEQKTSGITAKMDYEDGTGGAFSSSDIISVPIIQNTKLMVDELVPPMEIYMGQPASAEVDFYNTGKTTLYNLYIKAEGDFDVMEATGYYVGNLESGKKDSYSFSFIPREVGDVEGTVTFIYENINGEEQVYEMPFIFSAMEMPVFDEEEMYMEEEKKTPWGLIIGGVVLVLAIAGIIIFRKIRKKKVNKALELADEAFLTEFDLEDEGETKDLSKSQDDNKANEGKPAEQDINTKKKDETKKKHKFSLKKKK